MIADSTPNTIIRSVSPHMAPMIARARRNGSGVCHFRQGNQLAIYVHAIAEPALGEGTDMVHIEWTSPAGYSDDPTTHPGRILRASDGVRVNQLAIPFEEALQIGAAQAAERQK